MLRSAILPAVKAFFAKGAVEMKVSPAINDPYKANRIAYYAKCAFEYFISLTVSGAILTRLLLVLGVSDALTGVISALTTFATGIQFMTTSFMRRRKSIRATVITVCTLHQVAQAAMFLLPFLPVHHTLRVVLFVALFLVPTVIKNLTGSAIYNMYIVYVDPLKRGSFSATNSMVSLIIGMIYNYVMSWMVDYFDANGKLHVSLLLCAAVILFWTVCHAVSIRLSKDAPQVLEDIRQSPPLIQNLKENLSNTTFSKLLILPIARNFIELFATSYHTVYLLQEIGSSVTFVAITGIVSGIAQFVFMLPMGKFADRFGHVKSLTVAFCAMAVANLMLTFWVPANGEWLYLVSRFPHAIGISCITVSLNNLLFNYTPQKNWVSALGIYSSLGGVFGFLGSLLGGAILGAVQTAGNRVFGFHLYGQQLLNLLSVLGYGALILYELRVIAKLKKTY